MPGQAHASRWTAAVLGLLTAAAPPACAAPPSPPASPAAVAFFETKVRPVLADNCFKCHGPKKHQGGLRLDSRAALLAGGDQGPAAVPGEPERSLLVKAVRHQDEDLKMPPTMKLSARQIDDLVQWVRLGVPWPGADQTAPPSRPAGEFQVGDRDRAHWAFRPVRRLALPAPKEPAAGANPVDAFVLARLEAKGLHLGPPATRRELIRRAYFDLVGLPPTPEDVDAFVQDGRPDAWERLLDRLLASSQYGERWGRHWLDVVRFGQTHGYERDDEKPNAWRYRDYVIRAFNADKPYDQFVREHLAGDEIEPVTDDGKTATAFYRLGVWDDEPDDARQAEFDALDDVLSTAGEAFLGLTLGCARCHDHKFDPLGQEDYYSLLAFFRNVAPTKRNDAAPIQLALAAGGKTLAVTEGGPEPPATHVLIRGNAATPGKEVGPRFPLVLCASKETATPAISKPPAGSKTSGRRRVLAAWVASADNPLTARVMANRVWQHHFGKGLVASPSDFGRNGTAPTHPELLDWLASDFVDGGWRLKRLHKALMTSRTYRQSSRVRDEGAIDPDNTLLWRQNLRRLEAEAVRDAVLAVSGRLNPAMGGRGIFPTLPPEVLSTQSRPGLGWDKSDPWEESRRSVYVYVKRTLGVPLLETFDFATPDKSVAARPTTTIAPQALILLNSSFTEEQSAAFAGRLLREGADPARNVERAFRLALGRSPTPREAQVALAYLARDKDYRPALARLCKLILNLNEFVYVD
jgi:hypothetical protein